MILANSSWKAGSFRVSALTFPPLTFLSQACRLPESFRTSSQMCQYFALLETTFLAQLLRPWSVHSKPAVSAGPQPLAPSSCASFHLLYLAIHKDGSPRGLVVEFPGE